MQVKSSSGRDMKKIKKREQKNGVAKKKIKNKIRERFEDIAKKWGGDEKK